MMNQKQVMLIMVILMVISLIFAGIGVGMQQKVRKMEKKFHLDLDHYFSNSKEIRDGAASGSALNDQLIEIQQAPSELLRLKLVGIGRILAGIYILLFGILMALIMMPTRLSTAMKKR